MQQRLCRTGRAATQACVVALALCCMPGPLRAADAPALPDLASAKQMITADDRRRPVNAVSLAEALLAAGGLDAEDRRWLRTRLVRDLVRLRRYDQALAQADVGRQEAGNERDRLHFERLTLLALVDARRFEEAAARYEKVAAALAALAGDEHKDARLIAADSWRLAGMSLTRLGRLPEATEVLTRALRILDERPDAVHERAQALTAMALVHSRSGRVEEALRTEQVAIDASEAAGERSNLSSLYLRKAHFLGLLGRVDEQLAVLLVGRTQAKGELNDFNLAVAMTNLADVALKKKDYRSALGYADEAIGLVEKTGGGEPLWVCWVNKGIALNRLGGQHEGLDWIRKAIAAFGAAPGGAANAADVQGLLAEELAFNHDYERAYAAATQFKRMADEVRKTADEKRIAETHARYEADKRERQIQDLEQQQRHQQRFRWVLALAAATGLVAAVVAVVSRQHVKRAYRAMRDMAFSDPLTGLRNRRHLVSTVQDELALARRRLDTRGGANHDVVFMMIDLDHFKAVNDLHGHAAGDAVLKQCAAVLQRLLRESDTLARWGGEEFLVMARHTQAAETHLLAERLRAGIAAHDFVLDDGQVLRKTCSIGYACHPLRPQHEAEPQDWSATVALADQCLYLAKASGRDCWVGITAKDLDRDPQPADIPAELRAGVEAGLWQLCWSKGRELVWPGESGVSPA